MGAEAEEDCRSSTAGEGVILGFCIDDFIRCAFLSLSLLQKKKKQYNTPCPHLGKCQIATCHCTHTINNLHLLQMDTMILIPRVNQTTK